MLRVLSVAEARALIQTATPTGVAATVCSGRFEQGYRLADGSHVDHYISFGAFDKFVLTSSDYRESSPKHIEQWYR